MAPFPQLRTFLEVFRTGSISRAAETLGMTQPAASAHVRGLETQLGKALFHRHARGVEPTRVAEDLARRIEQPFDRLELEFDAVRVRGVGASGTVTLVGPAEIVRARFLPAITALREAGLEVRVETGGQDAIYDRLKSGAADLAVTASQRPDAEIGFRTLLVETLLPVASAKWARRTLGDDRRFGAALGYPPIAYDGDLPLIREVLQAEGAQALPPVIAASDLGMVADLVLAHQGWSVLPDYLVGAALSSGAAVALTTTRPLPVNAINLAWMKSALRHPRVAFARDAVLRVFEPS